MLSGSKRKEVIYMKRGPEYGCPEPVLPEREIKREVPRLGPADLVRYFIAGQLLISPNISNRRLIGSVAVEFHIDGEQVLVFGEKKSRNVWLHPDASAKLLGRFGGEPVSSAIPLDEQLDWL